MKNLQNLIKLPLLVLLFLSSQCLSSSFTPKDNYLINCGSTTNTTIDGRVFISDSNSILLSGSQSISLTDPNPSPDFSSLYQTARIFTKLSSYKFKINGQGTHMVRFHFFPFSSQQDLTSASFHVSASKVVFLRDFSVPNKTLVVKEYIMEVLDEKLEILFSPSTSSLAFVNAIEVFSVPDDLVNNSAKYVTLTGTEKFYSLSEHRLEKVHRVNVGGPRVTPSNDTLWRSWVPDDGFLLLSSSAKAVSFSGMIDYGEYGREIAPDSVYRTAKQMNKLDLADPVFNMTWTFQVDLGYRYLVRMHFCDIVSKSEKSASQLYFIVYINDLFAKEFQPYDIVSTAEPVPFYIDYVADPESTGFINISLGPSSMSSPSNRTAILNGLEIMKLNNSMGGFSGRVSESSKLGSRSKKRVAIGVLIGSILGGLAFLVFLVAKCRQLQMPKETSVEWQTMPLHGRNSQSLGTNIIEVANLSPSPNINLSLQIPFDEIKLATNDFNDNSVIGSGGFGKVYKGVLRDGTRVAVKRGMPGSRQGRLEFHTEIYVLSRIRHRHLVSLIGYCKEQSEMILVYEFMEKGPLKKHLYGSNLPCLSWKQRLEICVDSARGLHYLHTGYSQRIIHRDVKSANILLDENFLAKVADFGLSKFGLAFDQTHISTAVKGSFGYLDPEYYKRHQLTEKSDVYSFGVLLLEVICARPVIDYTLPNEQVNLAEWAMHFQKRGLLKQIVDPRIADQINSRSLRKYGETAEKCLAEYGVDRPTVGHVRWNLEYALELQETSMRREPHEDSASGKAFLPLPSVRREPSSSTRVGEAAETSDEQSETNVGQVFSQLITDEGR